MQNSSTDYERFEQGETDDSLGAETLPADGRLLAGFSTLSHAELCALIESGKPAMNKDDLRFCQEYYQAEDRLPTLGELRFLDRLVFLRSSSAEGVVLGAVTAEEPAIAETYDDLCVKAKALLPERRLPFGLSELAKLGGSYLRMIGREADMDELSAPDGLCDPKAEQLLTSPSGVPLLCVNAMERQGGFDGLERSESAFLLVTLGEDAQQDYEEAIASFCSDPELTPLYRNTFRVGRYGLIGTLAQRCGGVLADLSRLPDSSDKTRSLSCFADAYEGCLILSAPRANAPWLSESAPRHGLRTTYFAKATESGRFCTVSDTRPSVNLGLSFLRSLLGGKARKNCHIPKESMLSACVHLPLSLSGKEGERRLIRAGQSWQVGRLTLSSAYSEAERNGFSAGINTAMDALLGVIACGADRRCVGLSFAYSLPAEQVEDDSLAVSLALVLGAYRVMIELACPEQASHIRFTAGKPSIACTAFSPLRQEALPSTVRSAAGVLVFLPIGRTADGVPSFEGLRRLCDRFRRLCEEGKVLAARAVMGGLSDAMDAMTEGYAVHRSSLAAEYDGCFCQGILCQTVGETDLPVVGEIRFSSEI